MLTGYSKSIGLPAKRFSFFFFLITLRWMVRGWFHIRVDPRTMIDLTDRRRSVSSSVYFELTSILSFFLKDVEGEIRL